MPFVLATNLGHGWVMDSYRRQSREPSVKYGAADLLAIATVLSGEDLSQRLEEVELERREVDLLNPDEYVPACQIDT